MQFVVCGKCTAACLFQMYQEHFLLLKIDIQLCDAWCRIRVRVSELAQKFKDQPQKFSWQLHIRTVHDVLFYLLR